MLRVARTGAKRVAELYSKSGEGLKLSLEEMLKLCGVSSLNQDVEFSLRMALRKLKLQLLPFDGYYLVISG